jgi:hypothetical protein
VFLRSQQPIPFKQLGNKPPFKNLISIEDFTPSGPNRGGFCTMLKQGEVVIAAATAPALRGSRATAKK